MTNHANVPTLLAAQSPLESIKQIDPDGNEFWSGRALRPIFGYSAWQRLVITYQEVYSSFYLENPSQTEILPTVIEAQIGSGAIRKIEDWKLSCIALDRVLSRIASHKPEAIRELRKRNNARWRMETEIGALLLDFCEHAGLSITHQKLLETYRYDFCIDEYLLIEVDEGHHQTEPKQKENDHRKAELASQYGYKLLRIPIPVDSVAKLCGAIFRVLDDRD